MRRVLLTVLGLSPKATLYSMAGRVDSEPAQICPIAVVRLMETERRPTHVFAIVTAVAREQTLPALVSGLAAIDPAIVVEPVEVSNIGDTRDLNSMLETIAAIFEPGDILTLDVTHGLRHMPFLMYALSLYVTALRDVTLEAAYYGVFDTPGNAKPILDLAPLLELPRWFQAVEGFRDRGDAKGISILIRERHGARLDGRPHPLSLSHLASNLSDGAVALAAGLPLETGLAAGAALAELDRGALKDALHDVPLAGPLEALVRQHLEEIAVLQRIARVKHAIDLNEDELARQLRVIEVLIESQDWCSAAGNLREWFVSWMLLRNADCGSLPADSWLPHSSRETTEHRLGRLSNALQTPAIRGAFDENQLSFADAWDTCTTVRNACMHFGMRLDTVSPKMDEVRGLLIFARDILERRPNLPNEVNAD